MIEQCLKRTFNCTLCGKEIELDWSIPFKGIFPPPIFPNGWSEYEYFTICEDHRQHIIEFLNDLKFEIGKKERSKIFR